VPAEPAAQADEEFGGPKIPRFVEEVDEEEEAARRREELHNW
jgi:hypothetical protein